MPERDVTLAGKERSQCRITIAHSGIRGGKASQLLLRVQIGDTGDGLTLILCPRLLEATNRHNRPGKCFRRSNSRSAQDVSQKGPPPWTNPDCWGRSRAQSPHRAHTIDTSAGSFDRLAIKLPETSSNTFTSALTFSEQRQNSLTDAGLDDVIFFCFFFFCMVGANETRAGRIRSMRNSVNSAHPKKILPAV